jgi:arylsulfatase A-like enzyme
MSRPRIAVLGAAVLAFAWATCACAQGDKNLAAPSCAPGTPKHRVIVMVWDGLRPTSVNERDTPNLARLRREGVEFSDHHSTYPTVTMINAASLASGAFPEHSGFYGNKVYAPGAEGNDSGGQPISSQRPLFVEDYGVLEALDRHYGGALLKKETLFQRAQRACLRTAAIGKTGPAFLQDYKRGGIILDEHHAWPRGFVEGLVAAGVPLPLRSPNAYRDPPLVLPEENRDPTAFAAVARMDDDSVGDPVTGQESLSKRANQYLMRQFIDRVLPDQQPALAFVWLRDPDHTEHQYGPGAPAVQDALRAQDVLLGELLAKLKTLGLERRTDLIVVSDHGHSTVSGPQQFFPPRWIGNGEVGGIDRQSGYSVSGEVRLAELLRRADPALETYDDRGCVLSAALSGIAPDGERVQPTVTDEHGAACQRPGRHYTSAVPAILPPTALGSRSIVIAGNGGSEFLYLPAHDPDTLARAVRALQGREQIGAIFVSKRRYPELPAGTIAMESVRIESGDERSPDAIVSYADDPDAMLHGAYGTIFADMTGNRGTHGTFGTRDVHNTLIAYGPSFRRRFRDALPSANVDVAPTIAAILGLDFPADGRVLREALAGGSKSTEADYSIAPLEIRSERKAEGLVLCYATDPDCRNRRAGTVDYQARVVGKSLKNGEQRWDYFDRAAAIRE